MRLRIRRGLLLIGAILLTLATGCGTSNSASNTTSNATKGAATSAATKAAAAPSGEPIKIGIVTALSGAYASLASDQVKGGQMAVDELNAAGGILGRPLQLIQRDDKLTPAEATKQSQELVQNEHVQFLTGCVSAATTLAMNGVAKDAKIPYLGTCQTDTMRKERGPYTFHLAMAPSFNANVLAKWSAQNLGKKWYLMVPDYAFGHENEAVVKKTAGEVGATVAGTSVAPFPNSDFSNFITQIRAANPDVVMSSEAGNDFIAFQKQATSFGLFSKAKSMTMVTDIPFDKTLGFENIAGTYAGMNFYWEAQNEVPSAKAFVQAYQAKFGPEPPSGYASYQYDAIKALADAIKKAGSTDAEKVAGSLSGMTFDYSAGPVTIRACDGEIAHTVYIGKGRTASEAEKAGKKDFGFREIVFTQKADVALLPPCGQ